MLQRIGRGTAWALRWFAKPLVKGSIPSTASKPERLELIFDAVGGPEEARAYLGAAAYNQTYAPPESLVLLARHLVWRLRQERDEWKDAAIEARKALSAVKRKGVQ